MKKKCIISSFIFIIILICFNTSSFATFEITDFTIDAILQENGDLFIKETIEYYSNENDNGVTRKIITQNPRNKNNSADGLELILVNVDNQDYIYTDYANIGDEGVYEYSYTENEYNIKVYTPFDKYYKTVTYVYTLKNVATVYNDIAEIYWNFIGDEWEYEIKNLTINVELPKQAADEISYVFGHGSDNGQFTKQENNITLYVKNIKEGQAIDARILFSKNALTESTKFINKNVLEEYIDKEEGMSKKIEDPKVLGKYSVKDISVTFIVIILINMLYIFFKYDKENKSEKILYYREKPYDLEPEILQYFYYRKVMSNSYYIAFLNLIKLGVFKLENYTNEIGKEMQKIIYIPKHNAKLKEYQKKIVKNILKHMENNENGEKSVNLLKLASKLNNSTGKEYKEYEKAIKAEKEGLVGNVKKVPKSVKAVPVAFVIVLMLIIGFIGIITKQYEMMGILFLMGMISGIYPVFFVTAGNVIPILIFLIVHCGVFQGVLFAMLTEYGLGSLYITYLLIFIFIIYVWKIEKFSKEENEIIEKTKGLRRFIKNYSILEEADNLGYVNLWEDYFILSIAFKLNNNIINYFYNYGKEQVHSNLGNSMHTTNNFTNFHYDMSNAFYQYQRASSRSGNGRSYSGSSGGFSGGSSSGGGGGRRWRRRTILKKYNNL